MEINSYAPLAVKRGIGKKKKGNIANITCAHCSRSTSSIIGLPGCLCVSVQCNAHPHGSYAQHAAALLKALSSQANRLAHSSSSRNILNLLLIRSVRFTTKWKLRNPRERVEILCLQVEERGEKEVGQHMQPRQIFKLYYPTALLLLLLLSRLLYCFDIYVNI